MPVEGCYGGERILELAVFSNDPVNGISMLEIATDTSVSDAIPSPSYQCLRSFRMILSVHVRMIAEP